MSLVTHLVSSPWITAALVSLENSFVRFIFPDWLPHQSARSYSSSKSRENVFAKNSLFQRPIVGTLKRYERHSSHNNIIWCSVIDRGCLNVENIPVHMSVNSKMALEVRSLFSSLTYTSIPRIQHGRGFRPHDKLVVDLFLLVCVVMNFLTLAQNLVQKQFSGFSCNERWWHILIS